MLELAVKLFAVTLVMVGGLVLAARASRGGRAGGGIRVSSRQGLAKGAVVAVVEVDGRRFLVGAGDHQVAMLAELDATAEEAAGIEDDDLEAAATPLHRMGTTAARLAGAVAAAHRHSRTLHRTERPTTTPGPRIGPLDRLRSLTVRSHVERGHTALAPGERATARPIHADHPPS